MKAKLHNLMMTAAVLGVYGVDVIKGKQPPRPKVKEDIERLDKAEAKRQRRRERNKVLIHKGNPSG